MANSFNLSPVDLFNCTNSSANIKEIIGTPTAFKGVGIVEQDVLDRATGEVSRKEVAYIVTKEGTAYGCISALMVEGVKNLIPLLEADASVADNYKMLVQKGESNAKREYIYFTLVSA